MQPYISLAERCAFYNLLSSNSFQRKKSRIQRREWSKTEGDMKET